MFLFLVLAGCASPKPTVIYMPFLAPGADSAGRELFQFYGYEDTLGRWHEWGYPKFRRMLATSQQKAFSTAEEGQLAPVEFFGRPDTTH
jgi:hypothetical protein